MTTLQTDTASKMPVLAEPIVSATSPVAGERYICHARWVSMGDIKRLDRWNGRARWVRTNNGVEGMEGAA
eukprot:COSAG01_NODE_1360_length_10569_cov_25.195224_7_plen_70_part_00